MALQGAGALRRALAGLAFPGLLRSSGWVLFGSATTRAAMLAASVLVARIIAPSEFGKLTLALTAITLLSGLAGMGLGLALTRQVAEVRTTDPRTAGRYIGSALVLTVLGGVLVAAVLLAARSFFANLLLQDRRLGSLVAAAAAAVLFTGLNLAIQSSLSGLEAFRRLARSQLIQGLGTGVGLVVGAELDGATGALAGLAAGQALAAAASFEVLRREAAAQAVVVSYRLEASVLRALWRFGLPTFCGFVAVTSAVLGAQVVLSHQSGGYAQVAIFSLANRWHLAILFLPASLAPVLVPVMTRLNASARAREVASIFRATMWGTFALAAATAVVIAACAPIVLGFSGGFYSRHTLPLVVMAAASVPAALNNVLSSTAVSLGAMRAWLLSDLVLAAVLVGTATALAAGLHATGLAIAYLAAYLATDLVLAGPVSRLLRAAEARA